MREPPVAVTERDRWLALGVLLAVLAVVYGLFVHPWWTVPMRAANAEVDSLLQREQRLRMQLQQAPEVSRRLAQVRAAQANAPGFLSEPTQELASAGLIRHLESVVAQASPGNRSCVIQNRAPLDAGTRERFARVTVQVRLRCGVPETASVLHALEVGAPRLLVGNLNILANRMYFSPGTGNGQGDGGLDVAFDLYGYLAPSPAEVADARR